MILTFNVGYETATLTLDLTYCQRAMIYEGKALHLLGWIIGVEKDCWLQNGMFPLKPMALILWANQWKKTEYTKICYEMLLNEVYNKKRIIWSRNDE